MNDRADFIASRVGRLPSLPKIALEVLNLVRYPETTATDLEGVLSRDRDLAAALLRMSGSVFFDAGKPFPDLGRAIVQLGFDTMRSLVLAAATRPFLAAAGPHVKDLLIWEHSLAVALTARMLWREKGLAGAEDAFMAGLVHDIGKVILDQALERDYGRVIERVYEAGITFREAEAEVLGFDHTEVGALLARSWNLPDALEEAVRLHHRPAQAEINPTFCAVVSLANSICVKLEIGPEWLASLDLRRVDAARMLEMEDDELSRICATLQDGLEQDRECFGLDLPRRS